MLVFACVCICLHLFQQKPIIFVTFFATVTWHQQVGLPNLGLGTKMGPVVGHQEAASGLGTRMRPATPQRPVVGLGKTKDTGKPSGLKDLIAGKMIGPEQALIGVVRMTRQCP